MPPFVCCKWDSKLFFDRSQTIVFERLNANKYGLKPNSGLYKVLDLEEMFGSHKSETIQKGGNNPTQPPLEFNSTNSVILII